MIAAVKPTKPRPSRPPADRVILSHYYAALAVVQGKTIVQAAHEANISLNTLKAFQYRHKKNWIGLLSEARERLGIEATLPPIKLPAIDPGLTSEAVIGINAAAKLIAKGLTHDEVAKVLTLKPTTIRHWQASYPSYWKKCFNEATKKTKIKSEPEPDEAPLSPEMTLTQFYTTYIRPICLEPKSTSAGTFKEYKNALKLWRFYTGDPPINQIGAPICAKFVKALSQRLTRRGENISPNTCRKVCIHLQMIFDRLGPRTQKNRLGAGLLPDPPYLNKPRRRNKPPTDSFGLDEISLWLQAAETATVPQLDGTTPAAWWRALILFTYNTGLRIGSIMRLRWPMLEGNVLSVPGDCYKGGDSHQFTLSKAALQAIEPLRKFQETCPKIFPWPHGFDYLQSCRRRMLKASKIPETHRYGFHALRKSMATELARINPFVAQAVLGHKSLCTTMNHYVNPQAITDALQNLPQPK